MTIRTNFALAAAMALIVTGCGSKSETEVASGTYTDPATGKTTEYKVSGSKDGEEGNVTFKTEDGEVRFGTDARLPAGLTPYPGSKMTGGFAGSSEDGKGGMAGFEVKAKVADVVAHYRSQIEAAGLKIKSEMTADDSMIIGAEKTGDENTTIQVTATQEGDMVNGAITYGSGT